MEQYAFGPFRLDCGTRELWRGAVPVSLTPKAYDLLRALVMSGGVAIPKEQLLKQVWPDSFVSEDTLTQNIATLRRALGDSPDQPQYIVTVPRHGYRFAAVVRPVIDATQRTPVPGRGPWPVPRAIVALLAVISASTVVFVMSKIYLGPQAVVSNLVRFEVAAPPDTRFSVSASFPAISPDGRLLAFLAARAGEETRLWVRPLASARAHEMPGSAGALAPFWSPDSRFVGFFAHGSMKKVGVSGDAPESLCECVSRDALSGSWHGNDILFTRPEGIYRISAAGGVATRVTAPNPGRAETAHVLPEFLPDGRHFLYTTRVATEGSFESWIMVRSLDVPDDRRLLSTESQALYADGHILFVRDGQLLAQRFDASHLQALGDPVPITGAERIAINPSSPRGMFSVSRQARPPVLAYRDAPVAQLSWFDRGGNPLGAIGEPDDRNPAISHDGRRVAVSRQDATHRTRAIWILDVSRPGMASEVTKGGWDSCPVWSPDDGSIVFARGSPSEAQIYARTLSGTAAALPFGQRLQGCPLDWSRDGRTLLYAASRTAASSAEGLWLTAVPPSQPPTVLGDTAPTGPRGARGRISPNGRWLAYEADSGGRRDIYVRPFPAAAGPKWKVSSQGGIEPQWRGDGAELFYLGSDKNLMTVPVVTDRAFQSGSPTVLFMTDLDPLGTPIVGRNQYVATPDGQRFLLSQPSRSAPSLPIIVVLEWQAAISR
jgi:DNA-binding winged helix-turn-helix (wHTH) protein/Tol biopolymer transport system component